MAGIGVRRGVAAIASLAVVSLAAACGGGLADVDAFADPGADAPVAIDDGPVEPDPGLPDAPDDPGALDAGDVDPDAACRCRDNDDCAALAADAPACTTFVCDPASCRCVQQAVADGTACDDGDPCTGYDACRDGACAPGIPVCECARDADCAALEDGDRCNGTLVCDLAAWPRACVVDPDTVVTCPDLDDDPCLGPACDPATGACAPGFPANDGGSCDDLDACTLGETCLDGACGGGAAVPCDDGLDCTDDACEPDTGCVFVPNGLPCDPVSAAAAARGTAAIARTGRG